MFLFMKNVHTCFGKMLQGILQRTGHQSTCINISLRRISFKIPPQMDIIKKECQQKITKSILDPFQMEILLVTNENIIEKNPFQVPLNYIQKDFGSARSNPITTNTSSATQSSPYQTHPHQHTTTTKWQSKIHIFTR